MLHFNIKNTPASAHDSISPQLSPVLARSQGSVILLVLVVLLLVVISGTAYLQIARLDRQATRQTTTDNIDQAVTSVVSRIKTELKNDLVNSSGDFLRPTDGIESYDYPWTNNGSSRNVTGRYGGNAGSAAGGQFDDPWLASTFPTNNGSPAWPHITNLTGTYVEIARNSDGTYQDPVTQVVSMPGSDPDQEFTSTNLSLGNLNANVGGGVTRGVDADGDGILDSRWTWAPLAKSGKYEYVAAIRIIDLSSLINVNTATATFSDGDNTPLGTITGYFPTDVDLSRLANSSGLADNIWQGEITDLIAKRSSFGFGSADGRYDIWTGASLYGNPDYRFSLDNEVELRYGNGLNRLDHQSTVEGLMNDLLRRDADESDYNDVSGVGSTQQFFFGNNPGAGLDSRNLTELRKYLTTRSGHAPLLPDWNGFDASLPFSRDLKLDLNHYQSSNVATRVDHFAQLIAQIMWMNDNDGNNYLDLSDTAAGELASQFAVAIQDYGDVDSNPSEYQFSSGGTKFFGLETLPFIREVYVQMAYIDTADGNGDYLEWQRNNDSFTMAIEIGNPFDRSINVGGTNANNPKLRLHIPATGNGDAVSIEFGRDPQSGLTYRNGGSVVAGRELELESRSSANTNRSLVIFANPSTAGDQGGKGGDLRADLAFTGMKTIQTADGAFKDVVVSAGNGNIDLSDVVVELQVYWDDPEKVPNDDSDWYTYDRFRLPTGMEVPGPETITHTPATDPKTPNDKHYQNSASRDGSENYFLLNVIELEADPVGVAETYDTTNPENLTTFHGDRERFGMDKQTQIENNEKDKMDQLQIAIANRRFWTPAELGWIMMLGFTDETDGDFPTQLSGTDGTSGVLGGGDWKEKLYLDLLPDEAIQASGNVNVPHAALILDSFTVLDPTSDGLDNDDDGATDEAGTGAERLIAGTININTASREVLTYANPMPETISDIDTFMQEVIRYRDDPSHRDPSNGYNIDGIASTRPGIATLGELLFINPSGTSTDPINAQRYRFADPSDSERTVGGQMDLYPSPFSIATDSNTDDAGLPERANEKSGFFAERAMARYQMLANNFTVRSDVYAAYILVNSYASENWEAGPHESRWVLAIFDRSGVTGGGGDDEVRVLGVFPLD